jgi:hypothetical protein
MIFVLGTDESGEKTLVKVEQGNNNINNNNKSADQGSDSPTPTATDEDEQARKRIRSERERIRRNEIVDGLKQVLFIYLIIYYCFDHVDLARRGCKHI